MTLELRDAPLGGLVSRCLSSLDAEARAREVELGARIVADPVVRVAPDKVERVLMNLLANAVRHAPPRGAVSVLVEPDTDHVVVAVEDTGNGLAPGAPQRMFERFWRADESRAHERRRGSRARDRPRSRPGARRHDLGRKPQWGRCSGRIHAAVGPRRLDCPLHRAGVWSRSRLHLPFVSR